ncbi:MAG: hypothetical protein AAGF11_03595 [Myxococcota bacterium]
MPEPELELVPESELELVPESELELEPEESVAIVVPVSVPAGGLGRRQIPSFGSQIALSSQQVRGPLHQRSIASVGTQSLHSKSLGSGLGLPGA